MIETYRGEALAWEADDLGHLNMRYYIERSEQARIQFCAHMGLPRAFQAGALSTLASTHYHIKYQSEIRPGQGIWVQTAIIKFGDSTMTLEHNLFKSGGALSATIVETLTHIAARTRAPFAWPKRVRDNAKAHMRAQSDSAKTQNLDLSTKPGRPALQPTLYPTLAKAKKLGLPIIGRGCFAQTDCDVFGKVRPYVLFGKTSDSVQHLSTAWPDVSFPDSKPLSGALLEAQCIIRKTPKAGESYIVCSGLMAASTNVRKIGHWILDPLSGKCIASLVGVSCLFNLETRKLTKTSDAWVKRLNETVIPDLAP